MSGPVLSVRGLQASIKGQRILDGVSFDVAPTGVTTLLGRNGVGKTTTAKSLLGLVQRRGEIEGNTWPMNGTEVRVQAHSGQTAAGRLRDTRHLLTIRIEVKQPAVLVIEDAKREQFGHNAEHRHVHRDEEQGALHGRRSTGAPTSTSRMAMSLARSTCRSIGPNPSY